MTFSRTLTALALTFAFTFPIHFAEAQSVCQPASWLNGKAAMTKEGGFLGTLEQTCTLHVSGRSGSLSDFAQFMISNELRDALQVFQPPHAISKNGQSGIETEMSYQLKDNSSPVILRLRLTALTDGIHELHYTAQTVSVIKGDSQGAKFKRRDLDIFITRTTEVSTFLYKMGATLEIKKPFYAPQGIFMNRVTDIFTTSFEKGFSRGVAEALEHL